MKKHIKVHLILFVAVLVVELFNFETGLFKAESDTVSLEDKFSNSDAVVEQELREKEGKGLCEIVSLRDVNSKQYQMPNGSYKVFSFADSIHRKNSEGNWIEIDNDLALKDGVYSTADGFFKFGYDAGSSELLSINATKYLLCFSLLSDCNDSKAVAYNGGKSELLKIEGDEISVNEGYNPSSSIIYRNVFDDVDIEYVITRNNLKENIVLNRMVEIDDLTFGFHFNDMELKKADDGEYYLVDPIIDTVIYSLPKPFMYDSNGIVSEDVHYIVNMVSEGCYTLGFYVDKEWLADSRRVFPVTIDPSITSRIYESGGKDTYINAYSPATNYGDNTNFTVQSDNNGECIALLKISLPTIPDYAMISAGHLYLSYFSVYTYEVSMQVGLYTIDSSWGELTATWNNAISKIGSSALNTGTISCSSYGYYLNQQLNATNLIHQLYERGSNNGFAIKYHSGSLSSMNLFQSKENGDSSKSAYFTFVYYLVSHPINNGIYFFRNKYSGRYMDSLDHSLTNGTAVAQYGFSAENIQFWNVKFSHRDNWYLISPVSSSSLMLGVYNDSTADNTKVVLRSKSNVTDGMLWEFETTVFGSWKIEPKTGSANNRVLAVSSFLASSDTGRMIQKSYSNDYDFKDEWDLFDVTKTFQASSPCDSFFLSILHSNGFEFDTWIGMEKSFFSLKSMGLDQFRFDKLSYITTLDAVDKMENANVIIIGSHGSEYSTAIASGTRIALYDIGGTYNTEPYLQSLDLYNYANTITLLDADFSGVDLIIYLGCKTAYGANNLCTASVDSHVGAHYAVGFTDVIGVINDYSENQPMFEWITAFFSKYSIGWSIQSCCSYANTNITFNDKYGFDSSVSYEGS